MTFETKSSYCRVARQGLPCYKTVERLGFKRRATAVLKSNLIRSIEFGTAVARRLKRALLSNACMRCRITQFARESVGLWSFRGSYVRKFELSHSNRVNRVIKITRAHNLHVKMLDFGPFAIRT